MEARGGGPIKMGFDHQATKEGQFLLIVSDYETGEKLGEIYLSGLKPFHKLDQEVLMGGSR